MINQLSLTEQERLLTLLTRQSETYAQLAELSARQRSLISGDDPDSLLAILSQRQALVQLLQQINQDLAPYRRDWDDTYARLPDPVKQSVSSQLDQINTMLTSILNNDRQDGELLAARRQQVRTELSGLSGGRLANAGYSRAHARDGSTIGGADLTG